MAQSRWKFFRGTANKASCDYYKLLYRPERHLYLSQKLHVAFSWQTSCSDLRSSDLAVDIIKQANPAIIAGLGGFHMLKSYLGSLGNIMQDSGLLEVIWTTRDDPVNLSWEYDSQPGWMMFWQDSTYSPPRRRRHLSAHHETCLHRGGTWRHEDLHGESGRWEDRSQILRPSSGSVWTEVWRNLQTTRRRRKNTCTLGAVPPYGRCDQGIYQNVATCRPQRASFLHCYQYAWHLCRCRPPSIRQGRTDVLSTHEGTGNFACLQGHLRKFHYPRCPLLQPWKFRHLV